MENNGYELCRLYIEFFVTFSWGIEIKLTERKIAYAIRRTSRGQRKEVILSTTVWKQTFQPTNP